MVVAGFPDPVLEFLKFSAETEFTTTGGWLNFVGIGLIGLAAGGADLKEILLETYAFLWRLVDRLCALLEKLFELVARLAQVDFDATPPAGPYKPPKPAGMTRPLIVAGILVLACALALGGARFSEHRKESGKQLRRGAMLEAVPA